MFWGLKMSLKALEICEMQEVKPYWQNYVGGQWIDGGSGRIDVIDPGTGQKLAEQALADAGDVDRAVEAARRLHLSGALSDLRPVERGRMVQAMGRYLLDKIDEIAPVLTLEQGKPLWEARMEIEGAARYFEYYGNLYLPFQLILLFYMI